MTTIFSYDSANGLIEVDGSSPMVSYAYNGLGDRPGQTIDDLIANYTLTLHPAIWDESPGKVEQHPILLQRYIK